MMKSLAFDRGSRVRRGVKRQERRLAEDIGGRRTPASGGLRRSKWTDPGVMPGLPDAVAPGFVAEAKLTTKGSLSFKWGWWERVERYARSRAKLPLIQLMFTGHDPLAVIRWTDFEKVRRFLVDASSSPQEGR